MKKLFPRSLVILLITFTTLAVFYSLIVPLFEGPDEDDHFRYAKFIADYHALPVQLFEPGGGIAGHQGWQPPFYYSLVAIIISPIDTSDYEQHLQRNYAGTSVGDAACCGRNLYFHTDSENFPFTRTTLAVHLARLLTILFGAITVVATYWIAQTILAQSLGTNRQSLISLAAASIVAFNPSFIYISSLVSNDIPLAAFSSLVLLMWVRWLAQSSAPTLKSATWLGVLISLALLTKTTALGLIPLSGLVILFIAWRKRDWQFAILGNIVMGIAIAILAGWMLIRNLLLYGDPIAMQLVRTSALFPRSGPLTPNEFFQISLPWIWQTFWGGPTPADFSSNLLIVLAVLAILAFIGMIVAITRIQNLEFRIQNFFLFAWLGFIIVSQIQFIQMTTGADQGRYWFPAVSVIALFFAIGLNELTSRITHHAPRFGSHLHLRAVQVLAHWLIGSFFALALFVPFAYTLPAYARPFMLSQNDLTRLANPIETNFANQIQLRGYELARVVKPGDTLPVTLYWQSLAPITESYRVFVHLVGQDNRIAGGVDVVPARGAFPTVYWKPGDAFRNVVNIPIVSDAIPGKYSVEVGWYPIGKVGDRLQTTDGDDRAIITSVKVAPREPLVFTSKTRIDATFDNQIKLLGYDSSSSPDAVYLTLYWQAQKNIDQEYKVFVQVLDGNNKIVSQVDQLPQNGNYPTSIWSVGEQIRDEYKLSLPYNVGNARIIIGLYRIDTGERLPVVINGQAKDHIELSGAVR
jgi:hypothetical protein